MLSVKTGEQACSLLLDRTIERQAKQNPDLCTVAQALSRKSKTFAEKLLPNDLSFDLVNAFFIAK